jgi:CxxC motif-containing protein (DUF1111 family)
VKKKLLVLVLFLQMMNCNPFEKKETDKNRNAFLAILAVSSRSISVDREAFSGGDATSFDTTSSAFFIQAPNVSDTAKQLAFVQGHAEFTRIWVSPGAGGGAPGLGPTFNATSCFGCHAQDGRGKPNVGTTQTSMLFRLSNATNYGDQFNPSSIGTVPNEGSITTSYVEQAGTYTDGETYSLRVPTYTAALTNFGAVAGLLISPRVAQQNPGLGLLEAIPEETLLFNADPNDTNKDGISGRANYVTDTADGKTKIGRFGWKANQPNINHQNQGAFLGDLGVTSALFLTENCPGTQTVGVPTAANCNFPGNTGRGVGVAEVNANSISAINTYMLTISAPGRRNHTDATVVRGRNLMVSVGCTKCHLAEIKTGTLSGTTEVSNQTLRPYTDLLLHDMGTALADGRPDGLADGNEWRTPPLWGVGLIKSVNGHDNLLHDGRARGFAEAILWHGGEAETSKQNFRALSKTDRDAMIKFLDSM